MYVPEILQKHIISFRNFHFSSKNGIQFLYFLYTIRQRTSKNECNISYSICLSRFQAGYGSFHPLI